MPMYAFRCDNCDDSVDLIVNFSEADEPVECKVCSGTRRRLISAPGMVWAPTSGGYR